MASAFLQSFDDVSAVLGGRPGKTSVPIHVVPKEQAKKWLASQNAVVKGWAKSIGFEPRYAKSLLMPKRDGGLAGVLFVTVGRQQVGALRRVVRQADEKAFLVIGQGHAAYGQGFRAPDVSELYREFANSGFFAFVGNPKLTPEQSRGEVRHWPA